MTAPAGAVTAPEGRDAKAGPGRQVGIVGGGMLGLGLALRLIEQGHRVTVIEGASTVGGLTTADQIGDVMWDRFYHVTLLLGHLSSAPVGRHWAR